MSDELEQTDQTPDDAEPPLETEVSEPQAQETAIEPEPSVDDSASVPEVDGLDEIVESLADEPGSDDAVEVEPVVEPEDTVESEDEPIVTGVFADAVAGPELVAEKLRSPVPWWPFWMLTFVWVALCGAAAYFLTRDPSMPSLRQEAYTFVVAAGLALTILGPLLAIAVWAFSRGSVPHERRPGMFVASLLRAAVITFLGVVAWTGTLIFVDALRLGLIRF